MTDEQQVKLKLMAEREAVAAQKTVGGACVGRMPEVASPGLRERVQMNLNFARQQKRRVDELEELQYLLDKNPEVARILELIESTRQ